MIQFYNELLLNFGTYLNGIIGGNNNVFAFILISMYVWVGMEIIRAIVFVIISIFDITLRWMLGKPDPLSEREMDDILRSMDEYLKKQGE